jgi:NADH-quinone oxidoreductase subunit M
MNLLYILGIPLLTALLLLVMRSPNWIRRTALYGALLQLGMVVWLFIAYQQQRAMGYAMAAFFEQNYAWFSVWNIHFHIGVDGMSIAMMLLTALVVLAGVLVSWNVQRMVKEYYFLLLLLSFGAYGFFMSQDLLLLFFFLEIAVIPKYLLIAVWGSGNKNYSANKLALMLMGGSALIFVGILGIFYATPADQRSFDILQLANQQLGAGSQKIIYPLLFGGFGVFSALFPFHTWVPDGHSSAPTAGSMFLAGISMKLGGYGCLKVATLLLPEGAKVYADLVIALSAIAILYGAFATLMQKDLKYMNAYSSISHCGFVLLGIGMLTKTAFNGAVLQMVSHGLMTALFFALIGMIYERTHTRTIAEMGGLLKVMPFAVTALFIAGLASLGLPGLSGFVAEMTVFVGGWAHQDVYHRTATVIACMSIVVTAVYILRAIGQVAMGPIKENFASLQDVAWYEKAAATVLIVGMLAMGLAPQWLNDLIQPSTQFIMDKLAAK